MPKGPRLSFNPEAGMDRAFARGGFAPRAASLTALLIASTALTAIAFVPSANAGTPQWLGTASSNWFTQGNWSPAGVPNAADNVTVDTTSPHATVINGGTAAGAQVIVGNAGNGNLAITNGGGLTTSGFGYLGFSANSTGTVSVDGTGSLWTSSSGLVVGSSGSGTLTITNGGAVSSFSGLIGSFAGGTGTVTVSGSGSTWAVGTSLWVGNSGTGTLLLSQGGVAQADTFFLGANAGSHGTVTVMCTGVWVISGAVTLFSCVALPEAALVAGQFSVAVVCTTGSSGVATAHTKPMSPAIIAIHRMVFTSSFTFTAPVTAGP